MNIQQFQEFLQETRLVLTGGSSQLQAGVLNTFSPNVALLRKEWLAVKRAIEPHFYGSMPYAINEAFPNELEGQTNYRKRVYESPTKDKLWKAITDTNRVVMSSNFVLNYGPKMDKWLLQNKHGFNGYGLLEYLGVVLYPQRVIDPNGWYAVLPTNIAEMQYDAEAQMLRTNPASAINELGVEIMYYPSENLIWWSEELMIFAEYKVKQDSFVASDTVGVYSDLCYRVMTKTTSFLYNPVENDPSKMFTEYYEAPMRDEIPAGRLGGRWMPRIDPHTKLDGSYYDSDFSFAVPVMNDLNVVKNQRTVITCTSVFSTTYSRPIPCRADGCEGGRIYQKDEYGQRIENEEGFALSHQCSSCKGSGLYTPKTMDNVVIPEKTSLADDKTTPLSDYIYHDQPNVEAVQELGKQVEEATQQVNQALTILQQKIVGQSAESKDADMQDKQTFLAGIAMSMARIAQNILRWSAYIVLGDALDSSELAAINVAAPKTFNIMTIEALRQLRDQNRESKSLDVRASETLKLVEKESDSPLEVRLYELLHAYTQNRSEALQPELLEWLSFGIITKKQYLEALFAAAEIRKILGENPNVSPKDVFVTLNKVFAELAKNNELAAGLQQVINGA